MKALIIPAFVLCFLSSLTAQYPLIRERSAYRDELFKQHQRETETWYFNQASGKPAPPLQIYSYNSKKEDSLIVLSASFNLPVDTLASINGFENIRDFRGGQRILVPSAPGLYLPSDSHSSWTRNLSRELAASMPLPLTLEIQGKKQKILYYQGARFPGSLRSRFILPLFDSPLKKRHITSLYGYRNHPVTGIWGLHEGCDYRAAVGTKVYSCGEGKIISTGELEDYGKFITIQHKNGYTSLYGHLKSILVRENQNISRTSVIAESGNTGVSTGPHLHFEIRKNGKPLDPEDLLIKEGK